MLKTHESRKEYFRKYYSDNKDKIKEYSRNYYKKYYTGKNQSSAREKVIIANRILKSKFLEMYGGKCQCCGITTYEFLCLDHIQGRNRKYKNETGNVAYRRAIEEYDPTEYRILCANCNAATRFGRTCPHKQEN